MPLRVAMLAPPWIPIPPPAYGGVERVIELFTTELIARGHDVTLFASPGTESVASEVGPCLDDEDVRYVGEVGVDDRLRLFAEARALRMPIRWPEPFGLVMT